MAKKKASTAILDTKIAQLDIADMRNPLLSSSSGKLLLNISEDVLSLHNQIEQLGVNLLFAMVIAGKQLLLAKDYLAHGEFTPWVESTFRGAICLRTAQRYMLVAGFVRDNMSLLRTELQTQLPELNISHFDDENVLRKLPASSVLKLISKEKTEKLQPVASISTTAKTQILRVEFADALANFLGTPGLVASSIELAPDEIASPEIVTGKAPVANRQVWPQTVLAILKSNSSLLHSIESISEASAKGSIREGLALVPVTHGNHRSLVNRPQLVFSGASPFNAPGRDFKEAMTLVLFSDVDRVADFADAFESFGIVKVPFVPTTKKN